MVAAKNKNKKKKKYLCGKPWGLGRSLGPTIGDACLSICLSMVLDGGGHILFFHYVLSSCVSFICCAVGLLFPFCLLVCFVLDLLVHFFSVSIRYHCHLNSQLLDEEL